MCGMAFGIINGLPACIFSFFHHLLFTAMNDSVFMAYGKWDADYLIWYRRLFAVVTNGLLRGFIIYTRMFYSWMNRQDAIGTKKRITEMQWLFIYTFFLIIIKLV